MRTSKNFHKRPKIDVGTIYFTSRAIAFASSMVFAILYSKTLGTYNRGVLTLVMTTSFLVSVLLLSGPSFFLRSVNELNGRINLLTSFTKHIFISGFISSFLSLLTLIMYGMRYRESIDIRVFLISSVYAFFSTFVYGLHDYLLALGRIGYLAFSDLLIVGMQLLFYFFLTFFAEFSSYVDVILSLISSYVVIIFITNLYLGLPVYMTKSWSHYRDLLKSSWGNSIFGVSVAITDRLDKIALAFILGAGELGKYSTNQAFFSSFRFAPDALSRLKLFDEQKYGLSRYLNRRSWIFLFSLSGFLLFCTYFLIPKFMGSEWRVGFNLLVLFCANEILRGFLAIYVSASRFVQEKRLHGLGWFQLLAGAFIVPLFVALFGMVGGIISLICISFLCILMVSTWK